jgi:hypothetical protein
MGECVPQCKGAMLLVAGIVIIAAVYMNWNIWYVIGILLIIKGGVKLMCPVCKCGECKVEMKKKKK